MLKGRSSWLCNVKWSVWGIGWLPGRFGLLVLISENSDVLHQRGGNHWCGFCQRALVSTNAREPLVRICHISEFNTNEIGADFSNRLFLHQFRACLLVRFSRFRQIHTNFGTFHWCGFSQSALFRTNEPPPPSHLPKNLRPKSAKSIEIFLF